MPWARARAQRPHQAGFATKHTTSAPTGSALRIRARRSVERPWHWPVAARAIMTGRAIAIFTGGSTASRMLSRYAEPCCRVRNAVVVLEDLKLHERYYEAVLSKLVAESDATDCRRCAHTVLKRFTSESGKCAQCRSPLTHSLCRTWHLSSMACDKVDHRHAALLSTAQGPRGLNGRRTADVRRRKSKAEWYGGFASLCLACSLMHGWCGIGRQTGGAESPLLLGEPCSS